MNPVRAPDILRLDLHERHTPLAEKIQQYLDKRLQSARVRNDDPNLGPEETAAIRGEIAALKGLQVMFKEPPPIPTANETGSPWSTATPVQ